MLKCGSISEYIILTAVKITKCDPGALFFPLFYFQSHVIKPWKIELVIQTLGRAFRPVVIPHQSKAHESILLIFTLKEKKKKSVATAAGKARDLKEF